MLIWIMTGRKDKMGYLLIGLLVLVVINMVENVSMVETVKAERDAKVALLESKIEELEALLDE